jgi:hypothetical protein
MMKRVTDGPRHTRNASQAQRVACHQLGSAHCHRGDGADPKPCACTARCPLRCQRPPASSSCPRRSTCAPRRCSSSPPPASRSPGTGRSWGGPQCSGCPGRAQHSTAHETHQLAGLALSMPACSMPARLASNTQPASCNFCEWAPPAAPGRAPQHLGFRVHTAPGAVAAARGLGGDRGERGARADACH